MNQTSARGDSTGDAPANWVETYLCSPCRNELLAMMHAPLVLELLRTELGVFELYQKLLSDAIAAPQSPFVRPLVASQGSDVTAGVDALVYEMANVAITPENPALRPRIRPNYVLGELAAEPSAQFNAEPWYWSDFAPATVTPYFHDGSATVLGSLLSPGASSSRHVHPLEQGTYCARQPIRGIPAGPIRFNGEAGVPLSAVNTLAGGDLPAFDRGASIGEKPSMRFELHGFEAHSTQVRVRRGGTKHGEPVTLLRMAELVRDELQKLMYHAENIGKPLQYRGRVVPLDKIILLRIEHISRGSFQPIFGICDDDE